MDYATPALFGVLALLAIIIYIRLGHLKKSVAKQGGDKNEKSTST
jgi:hypothetical protein